MPEPATIALARRLYDSNADPAVTKEIMSPDIVWDITPGFPFGGVYRGYHSMMNDFFGSLLPGFESFSARAEEYYATDDDHVFVVGHYHGETKAGKTADARFIHLWTVRDGKLAHLLQAADSHVLQEALNGASTR
ncbi:nuclear transport factor 2 family protein [Lentzea sp. NBC_00516]|uniref:nuclear transport factor 2 family protein n=1 Tax=Lentzea sp. NBC_00516 TaxID=2903582 RepID=UPI002E80B32C|nr:nuclear transport factor 2 family protein [Lentzea sp. NBC_00516]WUD27560.1 nuclear transport factor 2 family protein [Lentzea sp. NBC_00516]